MDQLTELLRSKVPDFDPTLRLDRQFNSLELFSMVGVVEQKFDVRFFSLELNEQNLHSVETWSALIDKKLLRKS